MVRIRIPSLLNRAKHLLTGHNSDVPKGHLAVYVGEMEKRFVVPIAFLDHPAFQELLHKAAEEFGFHHPTGGLTIPCQEDVFNNLTSYLKV